MKNVHKVSPTHKTYDCAECNYKTEKLTNLSSHMQYQHVGSSLRHCIYCNCCFASDVSYIDHMNSQHGLPVWGPEVERVEPYIQPKQRVFNGSCKIYDFSVGDNEIDLLCFLRSKKDEIDNILRWNTQSSPQKVQFCAELELVKPSLARNQRFEDPSNPSEEDSTPLFVNSRMVYVDFGGLDNDAFFTMIEQMLLTLFNFGSHGSGWMLSKIRNVEMRLVKSRPIKASSYLALPADLAGSQCLLNIRNTQDENCFLYSYIAQYHLTFGPPLVQEADGYRKRTSPQTYSVEGAVQPAGDFPMPMSLNDLSKFEQLNDVQVNIFR